MGFIKAFTGALSGTFADEWKDFYLPRSDIKATAGVIPAVPKGTNNGRGENTKGNENIISNGSKIVVPEGTALITIQDGQITGCIAEAGGYEFKSDDPNSQSLFAGDSLISSIIKSSWEKVKFGGQPGSQQLAFYVNLKEIPGLTFGTQTPVPYDDAFLATQVSVVARGTYSLKIVDPLIFVKQFVPAQYLQANAPIFDFADMDNEAGNQLFTELVAVLGSAFTTYSNDPERGGRLSKITSDSLGFAKVLGETVDQNYQWKTDRGLEIVKTAIVVEYDEETKALLKETQADDRELRKESRHIGIEKARGEAYGENMQGMMAAATGQAMQGAATNENGAMGAFMGMGMAQQQGAGVLGAVSNMPQSTKTEENPTEKLLEMKKLLDAGAITQEEYDKIKAQILGL